MRVLFIIILFVALSFVSSEKPQLEKESIFKESNLSFNENSIYVLLRGSTSKLGGYARQYNLKHEKASHIALALKTKKDVKVYHVNTGGKKKGTHFIEESIHSFLDNKDEEYNYYGIWELTATAHDIETVVNYIKLLNSAPIHFDYDFNLDTNDRMYCSEFVFKALQTTTTFSKTRPLLIDKAVPKEHRFFLQRDTLTYLPSDFFIENYPSQLLKEWTSN